MNDTSPEKEEIIYTTCASHCGGSCLLRAHVKNGVITRLDTDDGSEPQLRACLRGRAYRQRVYAPDRILYPLKRVGERGEGQFERITWDEAMSTIASQIIRVRDAYGPESTLLLAMGGDLHNLNNTPQLASVLSMVGGYTTTWGTTSFHGGMYAQKISYGTMSTLNARDDLLNSKLILMWGWNPATNVNGVNTNWYLIQAKEAGTKIIAIDPRYTDSAAAFAQQWIPIKPGTDGAMLLAMAYVIISERLLDRKFLDTYTLGFDRFEKYVMGTDDGTPKTPAWAEAITGVPAATIIGVARDYATCKPAALLAGIAPGRTAYGEQYHRIAITLAAMTGNVGVHGGDAAGRSWESLVGGFPYRIAPVGSAENPVDSRAPRPPKGAPPWYRASRVHYCDIPDFIMSGKKGGYPADCKLMAIINCSYVNAFPNINKIVKALKSDKLEFIFIQEQFMMPTVKYADIVLPVNTYMERNDIANGVGLPFYGAVNRVIQSLGESKSHYEIACLLAKYLGLSGFGTETDEDMLRKMATKAEIPEYDKFRQTGTFRPKFPEPYVSFRRQIADPANNPFPTPSGKIEIYSKQLEELNKPDLPPIPTYIPTWEGTDDPLTKKYPLQLISSHMLRRANSQFDNLPWLRELQLHALSINSKDAKERDIKDGDMVLVFNDRGQLAIPVRVTDRIMEGVVDVPHGAWYNPDRNGTDMGACPNVLTKETYSPGGSYTYNSCLVQVKKA